MPLCRTEGPGVDGVGVAKGTVSVGHLGRRSRRGVRDTLQDVVDDRGVGKRLPDAGYIVPSNAATRVESRAVAHLKTTAAQ